MFTEFRVDGGRQGRGLWGRSQAWLHSRMCVCVWACVHRRVWERGPGRVLRLGPLRSAGPEALHPPRPGASGRPRQ